ncbi:MAG: calcium-binding protein [Nitrospiraceae bacterium]
MAQINGTPLNDILVGTVFADILNREGDPLSYPGTGGNDTVYGLGGNDALYGGGGSDRLFGGADNDRLFGGNDSDELNGDTGDDQLFGGNGTDVLIGYHGNDVLDGGTGTDRMDGGDGSDTYYVDNEGDVVTETHDDALSGYDRVLSSAGHYTLGFGLEHLTLTGTANLGGVGNGKENVIVGNAGSNTLWGMAGNDQLYGYADNDYLDGGNGADNMHGGEGNDTYVVDSAADRVVEERNGVSGGTDHVLSLVSYTLGFGLETLALAGGGNKNGTGNENNNTITGNDAKNALYGLAGNDTLNGGKGNDALVGGLGSDVLDGGTEADIMHGNEHNDTYIVDNVGDVVVEATNDALGGVDHVQSSVSYTLGFGLEQLTLTGTAAINGTGNGLNNVLTGNSANNVLSGLDGNDTLTGGAGNDTLNGGNGNDVLTGGSGKDQLNGGAGNDRFDYNGVSESPDALNRDVITGFAGAGTALGDQIDLRDIDANTLVSGNQAFTWRGATPGGAGTLWYTGGVLYGNVDGDATPEFQIQLVGSPALSVGGTGTDILL